ncbi:MAG: GyrI-like domain-containing protein [Phycisphaerales bacterium]|nr:GyrI-like domain-containing protein [Phycisphaerales bacterium]
MLDVELKDCPALHLAAVRHVGPYMELGPCFRKVCAWAGMRGLFGPHTQILGVYHDNPRLCPADALRADACVTAPPGFQGDPGAGITALDLPAARYAVATHKGPYDRLGESYTWLFDTWLPRHNLTPAGPCYEIYLNNPLNTKPEDLRTATHVPTGREDSGSFSSPRPRC